jgi:UDP-N-acetylmuramoylalanine-D-glutamate ligase
MDALNGKRLVILGMARQGTSLARFAVGAGAFVTLSDMRSPAALAEARAALADLPAERLRFVLGEHPLSLLDACDVLALSGGVAIDAPLVVEAQRRSIPLTNDSLEFARRAPAPWSASLARPARRRRPRSSAAWARSRAAGRGSAATSAAHRSWIWPRCRPAT